MSSTPQEPIIQAVRVVFSYDGIDDALRSVTLDVAAGERLCILGRNGSGKSTFARCINALILPDEGRVTVGGLSTHEQTNVPTIRRHVGMVFQNPDDQMVTSVVEDDVAFGPENLGLPQDEIRKRVHEALTFTEMLNFTHADPSELSGGQKQRIAIAGVLAMHPDIVIFDEPTAMLDPQGRQEIMGKMDEMQHEGYTIVHVTHHMDDALKADHVVVLDAGFVAFDGSPQDLFAQHGQLTTLGLEMPFSLRLIDQLAQEGIELTPSCSDTAVKEEIWRSLSTR